MCVFCFFTRLFSRQDNQLCSFLLLCNFNYFLYQSLKTYICFSTFKDYIACMYVVHSLCFLASCFFALTTMQTYIHKYKHIFRIEQKRHSPQWLNFERQTGVGKAYCLNVSSTFSQKMVVPKFIQDRKLIFFSFQTICLCYVSITNIE